MRTNSTLHRRTTATAWRYLLPATIVVAGIVGFPALKTIYLSLFNAPLIPSAGRPKWVGLSNYIYAFTNPSFEGGIAHTLFFTGLSITLNMLFGLSTGLLLNEKFKGRAFVRTLVILPWALPTVVNAVLWRWILDPSYGSLNALLTQLHLISNYQDWLGKPNLSTMVMIVLADTWKNYPLVTILVLAGLQMIPATLYEAATVDGAGWWNRFWHVTLPGIRPALLVALVLKTIDGLRIFDIIYLMTRGGPASETKTVAMYVYQESFSFLKLGQASAFAIVTVAIIYIFVLFYIRIIRSEGLA